MLDLVYEARDIDQRLGSPARIDAWFGAATKDLSPRQDHGLFQAIRRTNRLDGEETEFGYIVDYKEHRPQPSPQPCPRAPRR